MSNQKISINKLSLIVASCIFVAASLNVIFYFTGIFTPKVLGDILLFTIGYVAGLLMLMSIHHSRLISEDREHKDKCNLRDLSKAYKSKMLNE